MFWTPYLKKVKEAIKVIFNVFYLTQHTCYFTFFVLGLKVWCVFYTYRTTDTGLVTAKSLVTTETMDY